MSDSSCNTKYKINKVFEKRFSYPIWKIEVDSANNNLAFECRNPENTLPTFSICTFDGESKLKDYQVDEKEWTLETIHEEYLILKKYGTSSPIQAGIKIINYNSKQVIATFSEYILKEIQENTIIALHRSIPSGLLFYIDISTGKIVNKSNTNNNLRPNDIEYPTIYQGKLPSFMQQINYEDQIWIQRYTKGFIWTYHQKTPNGHDLHLILSTNNEILEDIITINNLSKLILQPYFKVKDYIFFLSDTKQEIVTYLV